MTLLSSLEMPVRMIGHRRTVDSYANDFWSEAEASGTGGCQLVMLRL